MDTETIQKRKVHGLIHKNNSVCNAISIVVIVVYALLSSYSTNLEFYLKAI